MGFGVRKDDRSINHYIYMQVNIILCYDSNRKGVHEAGSVFFSFSSV